jgi:hypothetical protein
MVEVSVETGAPPSGSVRLWRRYVSLSLPTQICRQPDCATAHHVAYFDHRSIFSRDRALHKLSKISLFQISLFHVRSAFFQIAPCQDRPTQLNHHESHTHLWQTAQWERSLGVCPNTNVLYFLRSDDMSVDISDDIILLRCWLLPTNNQIIPFIVILLLHKTATMSTTTNKRTQTSNDGSSDTNATQKRLLVPTYSNKKDTEELDLRSMTEEELKLLQKKGKQSRLVAAVPISFLNSDDPLSQSCSLLPTILLLWNRSVLVLLHSCGPWGRTLSPGSWLLRG